MLRTWTHHVFSINCATAEHPAAKASRSLSPSESRRAASLGPEMSTFDVFGFWPESDPEGSNEMFQTCFHAPGSQAHRACSIHT